MGDSDTGLAIRLGGNELFDIVYQLIGIGIIKNTVGVRHQGTTAHIEISVGIEKLVMVLGQGIAPLYVRETVFEPQVDLGLVGGTLFGDDLDDTVSCQGTI